MRNDRRPDRRRSSNGHKINEGGFSLKSALYVALIILALGLIAFFITINVYNKSLNKAYSDIETKAVGESKEQETLMDKAEEALERVLRSKRLMKFKLYMKVKLQKFKNKRVQTKKKNLG